ncbi:MAG: M2 family metallopeptidase [Thermoplasmata archaeon]|nr:M2 family metallopeptidase [Thermoplasmata archaeon]
MATTGGTEVRVFLDEAERRLLALANESSQASWVYETYITPDSEAVSAKAYARVIEATVAAAKQSVRLTRPAPGSIEARKVHLLRNSLPLIAPADPAKADELTRIVAGMTGTYGKGRFAPTGSATALDLQALSRILAETREPTRLLEVWNGWHEVGRHVRSDFTRYVALANEGARELDFDDTGAMWRSKYDMTPSAFSAEVERLWQQVRPLYLSLHAYVRGKLVERYGSDVVPPKGPIPAHLLGNMWAQSWEHVYDLVAPAGRKAPFDLTATLVGQKVDSRGMVRYAERFFTSLGLPALPSSFWERSMFDKPVDREVVCHASAWDVDNVDDLRIKMCIEITAEDFRTIHHELGHNYYQRAYAGQPYLFRDGANDGFHEAIGDTIALSVTPEYLRQVGLLDVVPGPDADLGLLLAAALEKIAFLPFGLLIDQWRWKVFSGEVGPDRYNAAWWVLRQRYQGVAPSSPRDETYFDPGAKFHVPANTPYMRYFLAHVLQFQFHRALARTIGRSGPLHRASIFGSHAAGKAFGEMLAMGASRPWPEALEAATGEQHMDATALLEYFAPLARWLDEQNRDTPIGW